MESYTSTPPKDTQAVAETALLCDVHICQGNFKYQDKDEEAMDNLEHFFLIAEIDYPKHGFLATQDEVIEVLENMKENAQDEQYVITHQMISQRDYESLPEFEGF